MPIHSAHVGRSAGTDSCYFSGRSSLMESGAISPGEVTLPYAYVQLAASDAVEERRSGAAEVARVRHRANRVSCGGAGSGQRAGRVQQGGEGRGRRCGGGHAAAGGDSAGPGQRRPRVGEDLRGGDETGFLGSGVDANGFPWSKAMLQSSGIAPASNFLAREKLDERCTKVRPRPGARRRWTGDFLSINSVSLSP